MVFTRLGKRAQTQLMLALHSVKSYSRQISSFLSVLKQYIITASQFPLSDRSLDVTAHLLLSDASKLAVHSTHA